MNKTRIALVFCLLFFGATMSSTAQGTEAYNPRNKLLKDAMDLFARENYGSAVILFEQAKSEINDPASLFYEQAAYYSTLCAIRLGDQEALRQVEQFAGSYPESAWLPSIQFELGKLYFDKRRYREALKAFNNARPGQMDATQQAEYYYKRGYALMNLGKEDAALEAFGKVSGNRDGYADAAAFYSSHILYNQGKYNEALAGFSALKDNRRFRKYVPNYLIHIHYELGNDQKVIEEGEAYIKTATSRSRAEMAGLIANAHYNLGDYASALPYFETYEASSREKLQPAEHYRIGHAKFVSEKYGSAIHNFQEAIEGNGEYAQTAWYHLGFCYLNTGEQQFAQNAFLQAYRLEGPRELRTDALYNYVKLTIEIGNDVYHDPVEIVEEFLEKNPDLPRIDEAYDLLAQLYLSSRNYNSALTSIEKTRNPNPKLQAIYQQLAYSQALDYFNRGDYDEAIAFFDKALEYTPDRELQFKSVFWQGDALYRQKKYSVSAGKYREFFGIPGAARSPLHGKALYNMAYASFNQRQYTQSADYFGRFLRLSGQDPNLQNDAKLRLADSYFIMKDYSTALSWYNRVIDNDGRDVDYAIYQKAFCYGAEGNFEKKISTLKTLISGYQSSLLYDDALYEIASTSLILNDQRGAIVYFDKLVREKPKSPFAKKSLVKMGFVYYNNNQYDQAIRTLKEVVNMYPASLEAKEALNTLKNVYVDQGRVDEYFAYAKNLDFVQVSVSEEDSLTFVTGENYYIDGDCSRAIVSLKNYLDQFPDGGFVLSASNYLASCFEKQGDNETAMAYYGKILEFPDNQYTDRALLKSARYAYDKNDHLLAGELYARLNETADDPGMILEARDGAMRSAYLVEDNRTALRFADLLLQMPDAAEEQITFAYYVRGKAYLDVNNLASAESNFVQVDELTSGEMGAEAKYNLALIQFSRNQLDEAEKYIYELPEQYPGYDYWIASAFILLADIYVKRDNAFQAEQTLLSVIENYPGEDLKSVAREKLQMIKPPEAIEQDDRQEE